MEDLPADRLIEKLHPHTHKLGINSERCAGAQIALDLLVEILQERVPNTQDECNLSVDYIKLVVDEMTLR